MRMTDIWYEFDEWAEGFDENDANADVHFTLDDGTRWCASFYTYQNLLTIADKNKTTGEMLSGQYFYADRPIFVAKMNKKTISEVLTDILQNETELSSFFTPVSDQ